MKKIRENGLQGSGHDNCDTASADHENGQHNHHGKIVCGLTPYGAPVDYIPDAVEGILNTTQKGYQCPEKKYKAYTKENTFRSLRQAAVYKVECSVEGISLCRERVEKLVFENALESEAATNGEEDSECRNYGKKGTVCEGACGRLDVAVKE